MNNNNESNENYNPSSSLFVCFLIYAGYKYIISLYHKKAMHSLAVSQTLRMADPVHNICQLCRSGGVHPLPQQ